MLLLLLLLLDLLLPWVILDFVSKFRGSELFSCSHCSHCSQHLTLGLLPVLLPPVGHSSLQSRRVCFESSFLSCTKSCRVSLLFYSFHWLGFILSRIHWDDDLGPHYFSMSFRHIRDVDPQGKRGCILASLSLEMCSSRPIQSCWFIYCSKWSYPGSVGRQCGTHGK